MSRIYRLIEFLVALILLMLLAPVLLFTALLVLFTMGWPIFFMQLRPGLNSKPFTIYKFRTMTVGDKPQVTSVGRWVRKYSLDELPQLINILNGDLSFVGPRPFLMQHLDSYTEEQARRHLVKPGMTGWAQINGRNALKWEEKLKLDVWYVDNHSVWLDLKIIFITLFVVISGKNVEYQE